MNATNIPEKRLKPEIMLSRLTRLPLPSRLHIRARLSSNIWFSLGVIAAEANTMPISPGSGTPIRRTAYTLISVSIDASMNNKPSPNKLFGDGTKFIIAAIKLPGSLLVFPERLFIKN